jgi:hypothetical protein
MLLATMPFSTCLSIFSFTKILLGYLMQVDPFKLKNLAMFFFKYQNLVQIKLFKF